MKLSYAVIGIAFMLILGVTARTENCSKYDTAVRSIIYLDFFLQFFEIFFHLIL